MVVLLHHALIAQPCHRKLTRSCKSKSVLLFLRDVDLVCRGSNDKNAFFDLLSIIRAYLLLFGTLVEAYKIRYGTCCRLEIHRKCSSEVKVMSCYVGPQHHLSKSLFPRHVTKPHQLLQVCVEIYLVIGPERVFFRRVTGCTFNAVSLLHGT